MVHISSRLLEALGELQEACDFVRKADKVPWERPSSPGRTCSRGRNPQPFSNAPQGSTSALYTQRNCWRKGFDEIYSLTQTSNNFSVSAFASHSPSDAISCYQWKQRFHELCGGNLFAPVALPLELLPTLFDGVLLASSVPLLPTKWPGRTSADLELLISAYSL